MEESTEMENQIASQNVFLNIFLPVVASAFLPSIYKKKVTENFKIKQNEDRKNHRELIGQLVQLPN